MCEYPVARRALLEARPRCGLCLCIAGGTFLTLKASIRWERGCGWHAGQAETECGVYPGTGTPVLLGCSPGLEPKAMLPL